MTPFAGTVWHLALRGRDPVQPASAPEGRFHHSGQIALYTSLSPEGAGVAIRRYMRPGDPPRALHPLHVDCARVADISAHPEASVVWQDIRARGLSSPTWSFSDQARAKGAQAMLYASRSRPDLTHMVVFDLSCVRVDTARTVLDWPPGGTR